MPSSKTIAIVANTTWNIYNFRLNVIEKLLNYGYSVIVFAPIDEYIIYRDLYPTVKHVGIRTLSRYGINPIRDLVLVFELLRKYRKFKPDLILHYTNKPNIYGAIASKIASIPSIATITGLGYAFTHSGLVSKITKTLYKWTSNSHKILIFQNAADKSLFLTNKMVKPYKTRLIKGSGVDTNYYLPQNKISENDDITFTFIGRLLYNKGIVEFANAAKVILNDFPKVRFWVIGELDEDNPSSVEKDSLNQWMEDKIIEYKGFQKDIRTLLHEIDCVILPSYREGLPRVILEALSMSIPVITTQTAGCEETVTNGQNGYLIPVRSTQKLVEAIRKFILLSKEEKIKMGKLGRIRAQNEFDSKIIANQVFDLVKEVLA